MGGYYTEAITSNANPLGQIAVNMVMFEQQNGTGGVLRKKCDVSDKWDH